MRPTTINRIKRDETSHTIGQPGQEYPSRAATAAATMILENRRQLRSSRENTARDNSASIRPG